MAWWVDEVVASPELLAWLVDEAAVAVAVARDLSSQVASSSVYWDEAEVGVEAEAWAGLVPLVSGSVEELETESLE